MATARAAALRKLTAVSEFRRRGGGEDAFRPSVRPSVKCVRCVDRRARARVGVTHTAAGRRRPDDLSEKHESKILGYCRDA